MKNPLLIIDDDEEILTQMKWSLVQDYEVFMARDRSSALQAFRSQATPVILLDLGLPPHPNSPEEGFATLCDLHSLDPLAKVVIITGQEEKETALRAIGSGAYDFLCKPVEMDQLKALLKRAFHLAQLEREYRQIQHLLQGEAFDDMLGTSPAMQKVFASIRKVASTDAPVLILGESGTGKERVAQAIHRRSPRKDGPFVVINSSAIPETLFESELFGHERGAFTGAHVQRKGRIESANHGTLFLDEIGEIPLPIQVKLLRFLQEQQIERVGGRESLHIDARVVAATNADLKKGMESGAFREDLFYRLAVVQIELPPLRDRGEDISLLAQFFLQRFAKQVGKSGLAFDQETLRTLHRYPWPGNVRELENRVRRAVIMAEGKLLRVHDLDLPHSASPPRYNSLKNAREALERDLVQDALQKNSGNMSAAANDLGVSRTTLYELMAKLGLSRKPTSDKDSPTTASD